MGYSGSSGTYAPPAFHTASSPAIRFAVRPAQIPDPCLPPDSQLHQLARDPTRAIVEFAVGNPAFAFNDRRALRVARGLFLKQRKGGRGRCRKNRAVPHCHERRHCRLGQQRHAGDPGFGIGDGSAKKRLVDLQESLDRLQLEDIAAVIAIDVKFRARIGDVDAQIERDKSDLWLGRFERQSRNLREPGDGFEVENDGNQGRRARPPTRSQLAQQLREGIILMFQSIEQRLAALQQELTERRVRVKAAAHRQQVRAVAGDTLALTGESAGYGKTHDEVVLPRNPVQKDIEHRHQRRV